MRNLHWKNWQSVTVEDFDSQGGIAEGFQALSLKGFIYFLPGLIRISLTDLQNRYSVVSALRTCFTVPDYLEEAIARQSQIMTALSADRRGFLVRYFSLMREAEDTLCPIIVDSAVLNLTAGETPYKHDDVRKWASGFA